MSIVRPISTESLRLLHRIYRCSRHHQVRQRAHCLILSAQGGSPYTLASLFSVSPYLSLSPGKRQSSIGSFA